MLLYKYFIDIKAITVTMSNKHNKTTTASFSQLPHEYFAAILLNCRIFSMNPRILYKIPLRIINATKSD